MKIICGNLISPDIIRDMLSYLPKRDLIGLKEIRIMLRPPIKKQRRYGFGDYHYPGKKIRIFLWSIKQHIVRYITSDNNYYHAFLEQIAHTLFHEVGHHVDFVYGDLKGQSDKEEKLREKKDKIKDYRDKNYQILYRQICEISSNIEKFARDYSDDYIKRYNPELPSFKKIPFIKIYREKYVDLVMDSLRKSSRFDYHDMAVIEHLRKCKISKYALYSVTEVCNKLNVSFHRFHSSQKTVQNFRQKIKRVCLKVEAPLFYVSKKGRRYAYFTKEQVERLADNEALKKIMREYNIVCEKVKKVQRLEDDLRSAKKELAEIY